MIKIFIQKYKKKQYKLHFLNIFLLLIISMLHKIDQSNCLFIIRIWHGF